MKYRYVFVLIWACILASLTNAQEINETLRQELLKMETEDQAARIECTKGSVAEEQIKCAAKIAETIDAKNTKRLNEIYDKFGFPTVKLVGKDGAQAYMLLLQHSTTDTLRVKSLKPIKRAFKRKEVSPSEFANFVDRLRLHQGKPQLYGQGFSSKGDGKMVMDAVVDPKNLDKRREKIGLPPITEYVKMLKEMYHLEVEVPKIH
jgi:hypothetical protein